MSSYYCEHTERTPEIIGDIDEGRIVIRGRSFPEDSRDFFQPFILWLRSFYDHAPGTVHIELDLEYYNTSTKLILVEMLRNLREGSYARTLRVSWLYDADDWEGQESGRDLQALFRGSIELREKR